MKLPMFVFALTGIALDVSLAELKLNPLFSDHAVLQQEMEVPVWGIASPGAEVTVTFAEQKVSSLAADDGRWQVVLAPLTLSTEPQVLEASSGKESLKIKGILVGEVWVGSGQSNMNWPVRATLQGEATSKAAEAGDFSQVRLFKVPVAGTDERQTTVEAEWAIPSGDTVSAFSATAFYFASALSRARSVPVGIIQSANGGTNAFSWINHETFHDEPVGETLRKFWAETVAKHPEAMERFAEQLDEYNQKVEEAKAKGAPVPRAPREPVGPGHEKRPTGHYKAMIAPLQPYAIRGVIWYQGEANSRQPFFPEYKDLMLALVEDWRADWATASNGELERKNFPFYLVQLPNYAGGNSNGWPAIREQMLRFWQEGDETGMVVTIDTGDPDDIHPQNKKPVGERLAKFALGNVYGEDVTYSGPIYDHLQIEGDRAVVHFDYVGEGLVSADGETLKYFEIADGEGNFHPAEAMIEGNTVVVHSTQVKEPRAVRYAWLPNPEGANLANQEGLPASPFRTDNWD